MQFKNSFISEIAKIVISTKYLIPLAICIVICLLFSLFNSILAIFDGILNFYVKRKNVFILETVQDRLILTKFLAQKV